MLRILSSLYCLFRSPAKRIVTHSSILCLLGLMSCVAVPPPDRVTLEPVPFSALQGWQQDDLTQAWPALLRSCQKISVTSLGEKTFHWGSICQQAVGMKNASASELRAFMERNLQPYRIRNNAKAEGLFTGYYEIALKGSRVRQGRYQYPVYRLPPDPLRTRFTRTEITQGALANQGLEWLYTDDPVQLFFLHVQGSGRVMLEDGSVIRIGFAGKNEKPYQSIGRYMLDHQMLTADTISAIAIKDWLYANPAQIPAILQQNPSYIFFKEITGEGPVGAQNVPLTPGRSLAVDKAHIPYGIPLWLETTLPSGASFNRLMIAQDTGSAIKGPVRGDVFFGFGADAEYQASHMKQAGQYVALLPK